MKKGSSFTSVLFMLTLLFFSFATFYEQSTEASVQGSGYWFLSSNQQTVKPTSIKLNKSTDVLAVGESDTLISTILPEESISNVIWTSSNSSIVTVDNGVVTAVRRGKATIKATTKVGNKTAYCVVTVVAHPESISLNKTSAILEVGKTEKLTACVLPANANNKNIIWTSSNDNIAKVVNGVIRGVSEGEVTILATTEDGGKTASCNISVIVLPTSVSLDKRSDVIDVGETATLKATVLPEDASIKDVEWISSNPDVATVNNGVVTAVSRGTATIKVTTKQGSKTASCVVTVIAHPKSISLNKTSSNLGVGKTDKLIATILPTNTNNKNINWTSSNDNIARVANGIITGVSKGEATITATSEDGGKTAFCTISVITLPTAVSLDTNSAVINVGETATLAPTVLPVDASIKNVNWTSSNPDIATVDNGVVTGVSSGTATIKATTTVGNKVATCTVNVINAPVTSGIVVFKDKNLDKAIRKKINKSTGDIDKSDVENIISLDIQNVAIKDISGIENLTNLQSLDLDGNQISDISLLKWLTNLKSLSLSKNQISDIGVLKELINLQSIYLDSNKISNISTLKGLTNVQMLNLEKNQINDISVLKELTGLLNIRIGSNKIEDISVLRGLTNLKSIDLSSNRVDDIGPLASLTNLRSLNLRSTGISSSDVDILKDYLSDCYIVH